MWQSNTTKLFLAALVLAAIPSITRAATLDFKEKTWETVVAPAETEKFVIRNDFDLKQSASSRLLNHNSNIKAATIDITTAEIILKIAQEVNQPNQSAELKIENDWATSFQPSQDGQTVDLYRLLYLLNSGSQKITLPVITSTPQISLSETNNLGINQLVAIGESDFSGSTKNRIINVRVGAEKFNGLIVKPGEEFSFDKYLGDVDGAHGFVPEIVIKQDGLFPEYGGGLCQVSSTAFRAAMNAGFPITERKNHAFAVHYYAPQGTDATIYAPQLDMKFINDLPSHMLVRTRIDIPAHKLYFEFYGTKDDRIVTFDGPYQYDKKPDGSMKAVWTKKVTNKGETVEQVFRSTYVSPNLYKKVATTESKPTAPEPTPPPSPAPTPEPTPVQ